VNVPKVVNAPKEKDSTPAKDTTPAKESPVVKEKTNKRAEQVRRTTDPAILAVVNARFDDSQGNNDNVLNINEKAQISFNLFNQGKGDAYNMVVQVTDLNAVKGIDYTSKYTIAHLAAGGNMPVIIPVKGKDDLDTTGTNFSIVVSDDSGDNTDTIYVNFRTLGKNPPPDN
jgi:hypothetical protein